MKPVIYVIIIAGIFLGIVIGERLRKSGLNKNVAALYKAGYVDKDEKLFLSIINSLQCKMYMSEASRSIMKLNFYISQGNTEKIRTICKNADPKKMDNESAIAFYAASFGYMVEKGLKDEADFLLNGINNRFKRTKEPAAAFLTLDCQMAYDVYIKRDVGMIEPIKTLIEATPDSNTRSIYRYRLAKLYYLTNDKANCEEQLKLALKETSNEQAKIKIGGILCGKWKEL